MRTPLVEENTILLKDANGISVELPYTFKKSKRRSLAISISKDGSVVIHCPLYLSKKRALDFLYTKQEWVLAKVSEILKKAEERPENTMSPEEQAQLYKKLRKEAKLYFPKRTAEFANFMQVTYGSISIRAQKTRWGSCSAAGNLSFNLRLMQAPTPVIDYVIVHELAHRKHMNHSKDFWKEVESILPDYRERRKWLKDYGYLL